MAYFKPSNINVVGSYARKAAVQTGASLSIDLAVTMPSEIFQEKDYLNYRYFHKRAYYLACIASGMKQAEDCSFDIKFALQDDNDLQPMIIVNPGQGVDDFTKSKCHIRIMLVASGDLFPTAKTQPARNCVRPKPEDTKLQVGQKLSTPYYNATLRSECCSLAYLKYLHSTSLQSEGFTNACVLGSVWLRQRSLASGGFGSFEWACTMALLMQGGGLNGRPVLSKGYSSYQLFKANLQCLATLDLVENPVFIHCEKEDLVNVDRPVLFDGLRGLNILYKMTPWSYQLLRHEARLTLKTLGDPLSDQFDACFITKMDDPHQRFNCVIRLPIVRAPISASRKPHAVSDRQTFCQNLFEVLKTGLGDRATLIHSKAPTGVPWLPGESKPCQEHRDHVDVGLLLDPEKVNRTVDRGPSAEDKVAAAAFQKFWGEKAELRRFKDGSIQETLTWSSSDPRQSVLKQIITYVIQRHIGKDSIEGLRFVGEDFDYSLPSQRVAVANPVALHQPVMTAFDILEKEIRSLEGLPLQIRQISAADPLLRYASVNSPILDPVHCTMDAAAICVQFEGSSRWPDDLSAVQRTKIAFLLKIEELLEASTEDLTARLGLENADRSLLNSAFLDVLYPSGAFFCIRIHHERELNLLERTLKGESHTAASREEVAFALSAYKRNFIQAPLHTQAVRTLSTRFPMLSPSMRLVKMWRDSHLLSDHISDELIELLTIRIFVHPHPWSVPGSIITGFLRTLTYISKWDWRSEPLILDFNGEMSSQDIDAIRLRFEAWRKIDPAMNRVAMFAASNIDRDGIIWTEMGPSKVIAARFTSLAKAACKLAKEQGLDIQPKALFTASMEEYDFVIHLSQKFVQNQAGEDRKTAALFKNLQVQKVQEKSLIGFKPVQCFIEELRKLYRNNVLFFHNSNGGSVIGGLWNPQAGPRAWKVNLPYSTIPVSSSADSGDEFQVDINKTATLHDIARLGGDMISRIEVKH